MKRNYLLSIRNAAIAGVIFFANPWALKAQIVNGGFENWTRLLTIEEPTGWTTTNLLSLFTGDSASVKKTTDANGGNFAARCTPVYNSLADEVVPVVVNGLFPINSRPASVRFFYKFNPASGDSVNIFVQLYKGNTEDPNNLVADLIWQRGAPAATYTQAVVDFEYFSTETPDTVLVAIFVGSEASNVTTVFTIDDITLSEFPSSTRSVAGMQQVTIFPNPGSDRFTFTGLTDMRHAHVDILDINGRLVHSAALDQGSISLGHLNTGLYFYTLRSEGGIYTGKVQIVH